MKETFGTWTDGRDVEMFRLSAHGMSANILTWGAVLQDFRLDGIEHSLVLGFPTFDPYPVHSPNFGSIVGRVANRIRDGQADIAGRTYRFDKNALGRHTLHGGAEGTGKQLWRPADFDMDFVTLALSLPDGHMGFPGSMAVQATYRILPGPSLEISISAQCDAETLCNFAHHSYFNLDGEGDARRQKLQVDADHFLTIDDDFVPTGEVTPVDGTEFDFRAERSILLGDARYDHNLCLSDRRGACRQVANLKADRSGIGMRIETTEPGLQVYDGGKIKTGDLPGLDGKPYTAFSGIALEPQAWPDAPNQDWADQARLLPGQTYEQVTRFKFG